RVTERRKSTCRRRKYEQKCDRRPARIRRIAEHCNNNRADDRRDAHQRKIENTQRTAKLRAFGSFESRFGINKTRCGVLLYPRDRFGSKQIAHIFSSINCGRSLFEYRPLEKLRRFYTNFRFLRIVISSIFFLKHSGHSTFTAVTSVI